MSRSDYWIHGVSTMVEDAERPTDVIHFGSGTTVRQPANTENWFHLPLPTPTIIEDDAEVAVTHVWFNAKTNDYARVKDVHLRTYDEFVFAHPTNLSGDISESWWVGDGWGPVGISAQPPRIRQARGSLTLCLRVEFLNGPPEGEITFFGAGAAFDE